jgi:translation initiation factor 3 subunit J
MSWDDSDDDWDKSDDELDARLGLNTTEAAPASKKPVFDDDEDLAVIEREREEKAKREQASSRGKKLAAKKAADAEKKEEEELARKTMKLEAEMEANMTVDERREMERKRVEDADNALTDDLFGSMDIGNSGPAAGRGGMKAGDVVVMKDLKDHLKHARKVAQCLKSNEKIHLAAAFFKECIQESKDVLDDDAVADIIKICNVIKNEKLQAAKRKVKGQAQKSKKKDKAADKKAKKMATELYGDNDQFDHYDEFGAGYEDDFF